MVRVHEQRASAEGQQRERYSQHSTLESSVKIAASFSLLSWVLSFLMNGEIFLMDESRFLKYDSSGLISVAWLARVEGKAENRRHERFFHQSR